MPRPKSGHVFVTNCLACKSINIQFPRSGGRSLAWLDLTWFFLLAFFFWSTGRVYRPTCWPQHETWLGYNAVLGSCSHLPLARTLLRSRSHSHAATVASRSLRCASIAMSHSVGPHLSCAALWLGRTLASPHAPVRLCLVFFVVSAFSFWALLFLACRKIVWPHCSHKKANLAVYYLRVCVQRNIINKIIFNTHICVCDCCAVYHLILLWLALLIAVCCLVSINFFCCRLDT